ncbi:SDR family oxidoreductase [Pseudonocardia kujensis]|uniref:SDR family NAD(P)-dependent oxidoreductase n=1 Tax=Pseudonocardia kujensis TaxID=1128675 RepID=UPI001E41C7EC|nr:SDR family NAD(P)-dependent oxidoreductase [Pseudonocardia kujensis]MCE0765568.1 SDR family oxidoreductase [Pseudonocardia kujensis]
MMLDGLPAIVTGAGSGICRAASLRLAAEGAPLALLDRDEAGLDETRRLVEERGGRAVTLPVDVTDAGAVEKAIAEAVDRVGAPRVLLNGAGIVIRKGLLATSPEEWDRVIRVNLSGYFHVLRAVVPPMAAAGGGSIVQIASSSAHLGGHGYPSYSASKGGVLTLSRMLAHELAPQGIRINSISPGATITPINSGTFAVPAIHDAMAGAIPLARLGAPADIVGAIAFLAGPDSAYVTGIDLPVDGGLISRITMPGDNSYSTFSES